MSNFVELIEKITKEKFWFVSFCVLFMVIPGLLFVFYFFRELFVALDIFKVILLGFVFTVPLFFLNFLVVSRKIHKSMQQSDENVFIYSMLSVMITNGIFFLAFSVNYWFKFGMKNFFILLAFIEIVSWILWKIYIKIDIKHMQKTKKLIFTLIILFIGFVAMSGYVILNIKNPARGGDLGAPDANSLIVGCSWEQLISKKMGIGLWSQSCRETDMVPKIEFKEQLPDQIIESSTRNGNKYENTVIRIFSKPVNQSVAEFIEQNFTKGLNEEAKNNCYAEVSQYNKSDNANIERYELVPTEEYKQQKQDEARQDAGLIWAELCGNFGLTNGNRYFEYHPAEDKSRVLFVDIGQDIPFFDTNSIKLFKPDLN